MPIWEGRGEASRTWVIKAALMMGVPFVVESSFLPDCRVVQQSMNGIFRVGVNVNDFVFLPGLELWPG
jgi:hypothetical protein